MKTKSVNKWDIQTFWEKFRKLMRYKYFDGELRRHCCYNPTILGLQANNKVWLSRFKGSIRSSVNAQMKGYKPNLSYWNLAASKAWLNLGRNLTSARKLSRSSKKQKTKLSKEKLQWISEWVEMQIIKCLQQLPSDPGTFCEWRSLCRSRAAWTRG